MLFNLVIELVKSAATSRPNELVSSAATANIHRIMRNFNFWLLFFSLMTLNIFLIEVEGRSYLQPIVANYHRHNKKYHNHIFEAVNRAVIFVTFSLVEIPDLITRSEICLKVNPFLGKLGRKRAEHA